MDPTSRVLESRPLRINQQSLYWRALPILVLNNSQGMGPCTFLTGSQWEGWNGRLVVGIMAVQRLDVLQLDSRGGLVGTTTADLPADRMRSVVQGPDGNLYVATDGGDIWRVTPQ